MAQEETHITVTRIIDHSAKDIFDTLSLPQRHHRFDGSGMVRSANDSERIQAAGDVFIMNMMDKNGGEYQTHNHVSAFDEGRMVGWKPALAEEPDNVGGWEWLYELKPTGAHSAEVSLTYSWDDVVDEKLRSALPLVSEEELEQSLNMLASAIN